MPAGIFQYPLRRGGRSLFGVCRLRIKAREPRVVLAEPVVADQTRDDAGAGVAVDGDGVCLGGDQ